jgi:carboxypeptidase C (cathepsin A)
MGGAIKPEEKRKIATKMAYYSGLSEESILQHNLDVPTEFFWKELLREESGYTIGRLDSRYLGLDKIIAGTEPDYPAEITSWLHSFTPAINYYFSEHLEFQTDIKYNMFGDVSPWDREDHDTRENLREAMAINPYLNVMYQVGYYDGATTYFHSKYSMWQMDQGGQFKDRMRFKTYRSGHMMYLRKEDLKTASEDLRTFILENLPGDRPARY